MCNHIAQFVFVVSLFAHSAFGVTLAHGVTLYDMQRIDAKRVYLELLVHSDTKESLLRLMKRDIQSGYLNSLFPEHPSAIDFDFVQNSVETRISENRHLQFGESSFSRLYYAIKSKENGEVIGTSEIYANGDQDIEISLYIASACGRQGFGHEVLGAELEVIARMTTATHVIWECYSNNPASIGLALKNGFERQTSFVNNGRIVRQYVRPVR